VEQVGEDRRDRDSQGPRTPDWPDLGYVARSRRPSRWRGYTPQPSAYREER
jgi:hypothetical protein